MRRLIRSELETQLARAMLANEVQEGDRVLARWYGDQQSVVLEPQPKGGGATKATVATDDSFENGVLTVTMPKTEQQERSRRIPVRGHSSGGQASQGGQGASGGTDGGQGGAPDGTPGGASS